VTRPIIDSCDIVRHVGDRRAGRSRNLIDGSVRGSAASDDDRAMQNGWRMIPVPPTDEPGCWVAVDNTKDEKTAWVRRDKLAALCTRCGHCVIGCWRENRPASKSLRNFAV
jgi:hypothetical protein